MLARAAGVAEFESLDGSASGRHAPREQSDRDAVDPHVDRQREAVGEADGAIGRLDLDRQRARAEAGEHDAARKKTRGKPRQRDVGSLDFRRHAAPGDAPRPDRVDESARGALDFERAAASRDELVDQYVDAGLGGGERDDRGDDGDDGEEREAQRVPDHPVPAPSARPRWRRSARIDVSSRHDQNVSPTERCTRTLCTS